MSRNPFGSDAETVRYAADQVNLPALAAQLRRIAGNMTVRADQAAPLPEPSPTAAGPTASACDWTNCPRRVGSECCNEACAR